MSCHKVVSNRPVYYSILELFGQRSQYISIKFLLHKPSENLKICYKRQATACNFYTSMQIILFFKLVLHKNIHPFVILLEL